MVDQRGERKGKAVQGKSGQCRIQPRREAESSVGPEPGRGEVRELREVTANPGGEQHSPRDGIQP